MVTGHIHLAEVLTFAGDRPPQIVAGISGTLLLPEITAPLVGMDVAGEKLATATTLARHGFIVPGPQGWAATIRDVDGNPIAHCQLHGRLTAAASHGARQPDPGRPSENAQPATNHSRRPGHTLLVV